jgi:hypothetical protein
MLEFVDVLGRSYPDEPDDLTKTAEALGQGELMKSPWDARFTALYRHGDQTKASRSLRETLLTMNTPERLMAGHGHYLLGQMALGTDTEYPGADSVSGWWYNRNLRIFANIRRLMKPGDRVLVVIGAGHVPIIRHAVQASPEMKLIEVSTILGNESSH